jgi:hypothetical protein
MMRISRTINTYIIFFTWNHNDYNKSTAHGCWTLDLFVSDIKLQAIYKVIHISNYDGHMFARLENNFKYIFILFLNFTKIL